MSQPAESLSPHDSPSLTKVQAGISLPGLTPLWADSLGDPTICIAVLDGPVDTSHPCFHNAQLSAVETLAGGVPDGGPATAHGTHVASIIFGQHGSSVQGIAPACRGLIVPVFSSASGGGIAPCSQIDLARAITSAVQQGAHVINISGGQLSDSDEAHPLLENAVQHCADSGVLIVAAVGNDGCQCLHVPAAMSSVLAVGGSDAQGAPLAMSNWGQAYRGILAPGENILGAAPGGEVARRSGTSFATPIVSGIAALLLSLQLKQGNKPNPHAVREAMLASADTCDPQITSDCPRFLVGRLNVQRARAIITNTAKEIQVAAVAGEPFGKEPTLNPKERTTEMSEFNELEAAPPDLQKSSPTEPSNAEVGLPENDEQLVSRSPVMPAAFPSTAAPAVTASSCGCSNPASTAAQANGASALVYAIGSLHYDFGTEARRDSFQQAMQSAVENGRAEPYNPEHLLAWLDQNPMDAQALTWTLEFDGTAVYAIQPQGPFAFQTYAKLVQYEYNFFVADETSRVDRISVGGHIAGHTRLINGQVVPVIVPDPRSLFDWNRDKLLSQVVPRRTRATAAQKREDERLAQRCGVFLDRIYYELRNMGMTQQERAINFAATKAYERMNEVFLEASIEKLQLDRIEVEQSPVCRPQSDCWDVKLTFFDPEKRFEKAKKVYRYTIDVSDVIPVTVGPLHKWAEYS